MSTTPCGCDLIAAADSQADERARKVMLADAAIYQRAWGCPYGDRPGPPAPSTARTITAVTRLVGAEAGDLVGCPGLCVRTEDAAHAVAALRWWKNGQLHLRVPYPSQVLVEAIDLIDTSVSAREGAEMRRIREEADRGRRNQGTG